MQAVILAGGPGLRLRPLTDDKPKVMVPINGIPIVQYQLKILETQEIERVIFACGYKWEKLREEFGDHFHNLQIEYNVDDERLGTAGSLRKVIGDFRLDSQDQDIVVTNGDVITEFNLKAMIEWHDTIHPVVTILVVPYRSPYGVIEIDKLRTVRKFEEKPEFKDVWINGGFYIINPRRIINHLPEKGNIEQETFPKLVTYGEIQAYPHYGFWRSIDTIKDLQAVEKELSVEYPR